MIQTRNNFFILFLFATSSTTTLTTTYITTHDIIHCVQHTFLPTHIPPSTHPHQLFSFDVLSFSHMRLRMCVPLSPTSSFSPHTPSSSSPPPTSLHSLPPSYPPFSYFLLFAPSHHIKIVFPFFLLLVPHVVVLFLSSFHFVHCLLLSKSALCWVAIEHNVSSPFPFFPSFFFPSKQQKTNTPSTPCMLVLSPSSYNPLVCFESFL